MLNLFNTATKTLEEFTPKDPGQARIYCCGPTVYGFLHVGNFRGAVILHVLRRCLERHGLKVTLVYNFTDVDDKIIDRAKEEGVSARDLADRYIEEFYKDFGSLKLEPHDENPRVSDHMDAIISMVAKLIERGHAYEVAGEVFYDVASFASYGKLSGQSVEELRAGTRIEVNSAKRSALDFTLWKPAKSGEPSWPSPWGDGRPGWHIECSAMSQRLLGEELDIHAGGLDLVFPHHENEIAQSEGCTGHRFVRHWVHNNMITVAGQKMAKSLGNVLSLRDFVTKYDGEVFKFIVLSTHYRSVLDFSETTIQNAIRGLARVYSSLARAKRLVGEGAVVEAPDDEWQGLVQNSWQEVEAALDDDLGTPQALAAVFGMVRSFNARSAKKNLPPGVALSFLASVRRFGDASGLFQEEPHSYLRILDDRLLTEKGLNRDAVDKKVAERTQARKEKDFARADTLRAELDEWGIVVKDEAQGTSWEVLK